MELNAISHGFSNDWPKKIAAVTTLGNTQVMFFGLLLSAGPGVYPNTRPTVRKVSRQEMYVLRSILSTFFASPVHRIYKLGFGLSVNSPRF